MDTESKTYFIIPVNNHVKKLGLTRVFFTKYCAKCTYLHDNSAIVKNWVNTLKNIGLKKTRDNISRKTCDKTQINTSNKVVFQNEKIIYLLNLFIYF